ncbi:uncharacterized protein [Drosophila pseudoobscura]|uniref:Uncharacterized protein n=1 Tax=Drosophila pseudoobscura pseudoobscura TaxID=46245 RepID=A0A6I8UPI0_DROPS|nr:uncharacterized protein LOC4801679 [Drosophila pseudoobscura]
MGNHIWGILLSLLLLEQMMPLSAAANLAQLVKKQSQQKQGQVAQPAQLQLQQQQLPQQQVHSQQYVQDALAESQELKSDEEEDHDPYQMLQEGKQESRLPASSNYPWSAYAGAQGMANPYESVPKMMPFIGYAQPVLIPFPLYIAPDMFYPAFPGATNDLEDVVMSRAAGGRRPAAPHSPSPARNSPIYYVRLPPTPYMFVPNMPPSPFGSGFSPLLTYQPMPSFSTFGSVFNLPVNFLANGKPSGIYQVNGSPSDLSQLSPGYGVRPPTPSNPFRPMSSPTAGYGPSQQGFGLASLPVPQHDSKLTSLKRPFVFNGRPEDIYILPNNLSPLYNDQSYY